MPLLLLPLKALQRQTNSQQELQSLTPCGHSKRILSLRLRPATTTTSRSPRGHHSISTSSHPCPYWQTIVLLRYYNSYNIVSDPSGAETTFRISQSTSKPIFCLVYLGFRTTETKSSSRIRICSMSHSFETVFTLTRLCGSITRHTISSGIRIQSTPVLTPMLWFSHTKMTPTVHPPIPISTGG
jgi:hypothetical protein